jgi:Ca2+-binding RTX toxin-like protein
VISGVPNGYRLTSGLVTAINGDGTTSWTLRRLPGGAEWEGVKLVGWPENKAGALVLGATVVVTDTDGTIGSFPQALTVSVAPSIDSPGTHVGIRGNEDAWTRLAISAGTPDADGSERIVGDVTLSQVPEGVQVQADGIVLPATPVGGFCTYVLTQAQLATLHVRGAAHSNADFTASGTMVVAEFDSSGNPVPGQSVTRVFSVGVDLVGVADKPTVSVNDISLTAGDPPKVAKITAASADTDGSESTYVVISGVPDGMVLREGSGLVRPLGGAGQAAGFSRWLADATALGDLSIATGHGLAAGSYTLTVVAVSQENDGDRALSDPASFVVSVAGSAVTALPTASFPPALSVTTSPPGLEDNAATLSISVTPMGAEPSSVILSGLPAGSSLSSSKGAGNIVFVPGPDGGSWLVLEAAWDGLVFQPPAHFSGTLSPTVTAVSDNGVEGRILSASSFPSLAFAPVADGASIGVSGSGNEDTLVKLDLGVGLVDGDGSETISAIRILKLGDGAVLTDATGTTLASSNGTYSFASLGALADVYVKSPANLDGSRTFEVQVDTVDAATGMASSSRTTIASGSVKFAAVADGAVFSGPSAPIAGTEGNWVGVGGDGAISIAPIDADGSEFQSVVVTVKSVPSGYAVQDVLFSAGTSNGDGSWTMTLAQFQGLAMRLPPHAAGDVVLGLKFNAFETSNANRASFDGGDHTIGIAASATTPTLSVQAANGVEDSPVALAISARLVDRDGSESLSIRISGVPSGATLSAGIDNGDGSWTLTQGQLAGLTLSLPANEFASFDLLVVATATEGGTASPQAASTTATLAVSIPDSFDSYTGTAGNDTMPGTRGSDWFAGLAGDDTVQGSDGVDTFDGGAGSDMLDLSYAPGAITATLDAAGTVTLSISTGDTDILVGVEAIAGGAGADLLVGDAGANTLSGGAGGDDTLSGLGGNDVLAGGTGRDLADYAYAATGLSATLGVLGTATVTVGAGDTDTLVDIEDLVGGSGNDRLGGNLGANALSGGEGDDTLSGSVGNDTLLGGEGRDTADYWYRLDGITATLDTGGTVTLAVASGDTDTLSSIENIAGGSGSDRLVGDAGANTLSGGAGGDDTLSGLGGNDLLAGGTGRDLADYAYASAGLSATLGILGTATVTVGAGDTDTLVDIEDLVGGFGNDRLGGNLGANALSGGEGDDTLSGSVGNDTLLGGEGRDTADYWYRLDGITATLDTGGTVTLAVASGDTDTLSSIENIAGGSGSDRLVGDAGANTLSGSVGDDTLSGRDGNDLLAGGNGLDMADYSYLSTAIIATLDSTGTAILEAGAADTDVLTGIENIRGGSGDDILVGDAVGNVLQGGAGNDRLSGAGGADSLLGGDGEDSFVLGPQALDAADFIVDFSTGDVLDVSGLLSSLGGTPASVAFVQNGEHVEVRIDQNGPQPGNTDTLVAIVQNQVAEQVQAQTNFG